MSIHRRRPSSPAAAPPLEDENLLAEILLRLPPDPSSLPRASAVCNRWRHLVSDARFIRRFRLHHRRNPPLLGFFLPRGGMSFEPTLEAPNRVAPGRFSLQQVCGDGLRLLGCRHGLVLLLDPKRKQALVWDPVTGDQHRIAHPPRFDGDLTRTQGAVLCAAGDVHFQVVLVVIASNDELHTRALGCVYSSETGLWGNLMSPPIPCTFVFADDNALYQMPPDFTSMSAVLVGNFLYWILIGDFPGILEFDLERQSLAVIPLPMGIVFSHDHELTVMRAEGGGLGLLLMTDIDFIAQLWKRKTDCDGVASWELGRTIELDKLIPLNSVEERDCIMILGLAECNNVVFLWTVVGFFMVDLESLHCKQVCEGHDYMWFCKPFESVYAADATGSIYLLTCDTKCQTQCKATYCESGDCDVNPGGQCAC